MLTLVYYDNIYIYIKSYFIKAFFEFTLDPCRRHKDGHER